MGKIRAISSPKTVLKWKNDCGYDSITLGRGYVTMYQSTKPRQNRLALEISYNCFKKLQALDLIEYDDEKTNQENPYEDSHPFHYKFKQYPGVKKFTVNTVITEEMMNEDN